MLHAWCKTKSGLHYTAELMQVFTGGVIRTMAPDQPVVEALAIDGSEIVALGAAEQVHGFAGKDATALDLDGGCLCPGFIDAHHHFTLAALLADAVDLATPEVDRIEPLLTALRRRASRLPAGEWILAHGYDERALREHRAPSRDELDEACPDHPVLVLHFSLHEGAANSRAFRGADLADHAPNPPQGLIERDRRGRPTGLLIEEAVGRMLCLAMDEIIAQDEQAYHDSLGRYEQQLLASGIVRVFDPGVHPALEDVLRHAQDSGALRIGLNLMVVGPEGILTEPRARLDGAPTGSGSAGLRVGPLKAFMDGGAKLGICLSPRELLSAARAVGRQVLRSRSLDGLRFARGSRIRLGRDGKLHGGMLLYQPEPARQLFSDAQARGFAVAVHALGNEAISRALDALPPSPTERPAGVGPHRIEHFFVTDPGHARRAAERGLAVAAQPNFVPMLADLLRGLGFPPPERVLPLRELLDEGVCVAGSSDAPVDDFAPLHGMWCAVSRRTPDGEVFGPGQRIEPAEALAMYTRQAAVAGGIEAECGSLGTGKRADLVWLSHDPLRPGGLEQPGPKVRGTWVGGQRLWREP